MSGYKIQSVLPTQGLAISGFVYPTPADVVLVDTTVLAEGKRESLYQSILGEPLEAFSIRVGKYVNPKAREGRGTTNFSGKLTLKAQNFLGADPVGELEDVNITISLNLPGSSPVLDDESVKLTSAASLLFAALFAGIIDTNTNTAATDDARLVKAAFGITDVVDFNQA